MLACGVFRRCSKNDLVHDAARPEGWRGALEMAGSVQDEVLQESARVGQARGVVGRYP